METQQEIIEKKIFDDLKKHEGAVLLSREMFLELNILSMLKEIYDREEEKGA